MIEVGHWWLVLYVILLLTISEKNYESSKALTRRLFAIEEHFI